MFLEENSTPIVTLYSVLNSFLVYCNKIDDFPTPNKIKRNLDYIFNLNLI